MPGATCRNSTCHMPHATCQIRRRYEEGIDQLLATPIPDASTVVKNPSITVGSGSLGYYLTYQVRHECCPSHVSQAFRRSVSGQISHPTCRVPRLLPGTWSRVAILRVNQSREGRCLRKKGTITLTLCIIPLSGDSPTVRCTKGFEDKEIRRKLALTYWKFAPSLRWVPPSAN